MRQWEGRCEGLGEYSGEEFINLHLYRLENEYQKDCDYFEEYLKGGISIFTVCVVTRDGGWR